MLLNDLTHARILHSPTRETICGLIRNDPPYFPLDDSVIHSTMKPPRAIPQAGCVIPVFQKVFHYWSELFCIRLMLLISLLICGCSDQSKQRTYERRRSEQLRRRAEEASASDVEMLAMQLTDLIIAEKEEGTGLGMYPKPTPMLM